MDGHEPEVRQPRPEHGVGIARPLEPVQERPHLRTDPGRRRSLDVHPLAADRTRDHLHRIGALAPRHRPTAIRRIPLRPVGNSDACQSNSRAAVSGWS